MDQPGKVANPARGQLNRENNIEVGMLNYWYEVGMLKVPAVSMVQCIGVQNHR